MTYPKCNRDDCHRPIQPEPIDQDLGGYWPELCGMHIDLEFCCNVSKETWGTKSLARYIALDYGMSDVVAELDRQWQATS